VWLWVLYVIILEEGLPHFIKVKSRQVLNSEFILQFHQRWHQDKDSNSGMTQHDVDKQSYNIVTVERF
jgi:hypothetical protein